MSSQALETTTRCFKDRSLHKMNAEISGTIRIGGLKSKAWFVRVNRYLRFKGTVCVPPTIREGQMIHFGYDGERRAIYSAKVESIEWWPNRDKPHVLEADITVEESRYDFSEENKTIDEVTAEVRALLSKKRKGQIPLEIVGIQ